MDCSPPGSSVHGILQARILEWLAIPFSRGSSQPRDQTWASCISGRFFTIWASKEAAIVDLPDSGIEHRSLTSQADSFTVWASREVLYMLVFKCELIIACLNTRLVSYCTCNKLLQFSGWKWLTYSCGQKSEMSLTGINQAWFFLKSQRKNLFPHILYLLEVYPLYSLDPGLFSFLQN